VQGSGNHSSEVSGQTSLTATYEFPEPFVWALPVQEALTEDDIKRLPPLFFDEGADIESLLLVIKLVAVHNPLQEVYLYEHEDGLFSALFVDRDATRLRFSLNFMNLAVTDQPKRFGHIKGFKPRSVGELFNEAEIDGLAVVADEHNEVLSELEEDFFPPAE
jgi:hypothetical protein